MNHSDNIETQKAWINSQEVNNGNNKNKEENHNHKNNGDKEDDGGSDSCKNRNGDDSPQGC